MKEIATNIDFGDSSYQSCESNDSDLTVYISSWDEKTIKLTFLNVLKFVYSSGSFISGIYENTNSTLLLEALSANYVQIPNDQPFKAYCIIDIEDHALFEIVAEKWNIKKL